MFIQIEKKVEGIRNGCLVICKKLSSTFVGSGSSLDKHQVRIMDGFNLLHERCYINLC